MPIKTAQFFVLFLVVLAIPLYCMDKPKKKSISCITKNHKKKKKSSSFDYQSFQKRFKLEKDKRKASLENASETEQCYNSNTPEQNRFIESTQNTQ